MSHLFLSRVYVVPTDIGIYLTAIIMIILTQILLWAIARDTTDIEIWRCLGFCAVAGLVTVFGNIMGGDQGVLAGLLFGAFAAYLIGGFIYDFELWQRIVMAVVTPIFMMISYVSGYAIKEFLFSTVFA